MQVTRIHFEYSLPSSSKADPFQYYSSSSKPGLTKAPLWSLIINDTDYYPITGHNYYLYEELPGRFNMLPWDMNGSQEPMDPALCSPMEGYLSSKLLEDPVFEARYLELLSEFLMTAGSEQQLTKRLNGAQSILGSEIPAEEFEGMRRDIITRINRLKSEIESTASCI